MVKILNFLFGFKLLGIVTGDLIGYNRLANNIHLHVNTPHGAGSETSVRQPVIDSILQRTDLTNAVKLRLLGSLLRGQSEVNLGRKRNRNRKKANRLQRYLRTNRPVLGS